MSVIAYPFELSMTESKFNREHPVVGTTTYDAFHLPEFRIQAIFLQYELRYMLHYVTESYLKTLAFSSFESTISIPIKTTKQLIDLKQRISLP